MKILKTNFLDLDKNGFSKFITRQLVLKTRSNLFNSKFITKFNFTQSNFSNTDEELKEVKNISEFKLGMNALSEGNFAASEIHLKECLKIFKNINQTHTVGYIYVLKRYTQSLFYLKRYDECEKMLQAGIELSQSTFKNNLDLSFPYYRNLIAFYTYTNITKASTYIEQLIEDFSTGENEKRILKYLYFAGGAIKLLNNEYKQAKYFMGETMSMVDLPQDLQAFNLHNLALINLEMIKEYDTVAEELRTKWRKDLDFSGDISILSKESLVLYKQSLSKLEINPNLNQGEDANINLKIFLSNSNEIPMDLSNEEEETLVNSFKNTKSGLTMTNIAEMLFEQGNQKEKATAFWLKSGIKHYENYEKENIARHLILFALFYSQIGQTMYAEGLYRKSIELLKNSVLSNMNYNLIFAMNMYGRLLMRMDKRQSEANDLLYKSEQIAQSLPFWYNRMCKIRYLDFDFE